MRIVHVVDRETDRGGAHVHRRGLIAGQRRRHDVAVVSGGGFEARDAAPVDLSPVLSARPDVVHVHTVVNPVALEQLAALPAVITVQDHRYFCPGRGKWTRDGAPCHEKASPSLCAGCFEDVSYGAGVVELTERRRIALGAFRAVTVLSRYMRDELVAAGLDPARVHVIPPVVPPLPVVPAGGPPCVLFVGRLVEHKGVRDAVDAWRRSGLDLPLVVAGTGPLRDWAEAAGAQVLGWRERDDLAALYARAAALLMPSRWQEPYGIAGVEAQSLGVPVVAWRSGGIAEWHADGDLLVEWGDVAALALALRDAVRRRETPVPLPDTVEVARRTEVVYQFAAR